VTPLVAATGGVERGEGELEDGRPAAPKRSATARGARELGWVRCIVGFGRESQGISNGQTHLAVYFGPFALAHR
jgi:hypothetical protein